jgi:hypothetical protein
LAGMGLAGTPAPPPRPNRHTDSQNEQYALI